MTYSNITRSAKSILIRLGYHSQPEFLIIGAQKAGTTFLYSVLRQHPQIVEPVNKEIHFFDYDFNYNQGINNYYLQFSLPYKFKSNQITFEATPDYLASKDAPQRIKNIFPKIKLIVILREPFSRAFSAWKMHHFLFKSHPVHKWLYDPRSFDQVIEDATGGHTGDWDLMNHIGRSLYGKQLRNYLNFFPKEQILILFQNDLKEKTQDTIDRVTDFIRVDRLQMKDINKNDKRFWDNKSTTNEISINPEQVKKLNHYYEMDKDIICEIVGRNYLW